MLGREFARDLLPVDGGSELYKVTGLVTPPRACRASRGAQHFFVNGRYVKNRTMMAALENAYKGTMMQGKFPGAVLMLEMPADLVDVNVHPAKTEIRFAKESDVFDAVYRAVRTALATPGSGECRFEMGHTASEAEQTTMQPTAPAAPAAQPAAQHRPAPDKNRFTTLSAAEYRALAGLAAGIPAKEVPGLTAVDSPKPVYKTSASAAPQPLQGQPPRPVTYQAPNESVLDILPEPEGELAQPAALQQEVPAQTTPRAGGRGPGFGRAGLCRQRPPRLKCPAGCGQHHAGADCHDPAARIRTPAPGGRGVQDLHYYRTCGRAVPHRQARRA